LLKVGQPYISIMGHTSLPHAHTVHIAPTQTIENGKKMCEREAIS
jgi:hypothetical protein